jgi:hypothetical protein
MYSSDVGITAALGDFVIDGLAFRYSNFVRRLYNFCQSLGFERGKILPSRAFCSDESQGYPIILIAKHFGAFPFNHGRVGGVVSTDRHGPYAEHGKDLVIIHASHVGYDPQTHSFGSYRRMHTQHCEMRSNCGKMALVLDWYLNEYAFATQNIFLERHSGHFMVTIDNYLLRENKAEGLFLNMPSIVLSEEGGKCHPIRSYSTSKCYLASHELRALMGDAAWPSSGRRPIDEWLLPELFRFKRNIPEDLETDSYLEHNLLNAMASIVTSKTPLLTAAQVNTQMEFDRAYRTIVNAAEYRGKQLVFISGLNIDISPQEGQVFPLTKFVPWAAFVQRANGHALLLEQKDLFQALLNQPESNSDAVNLEAAIQTMEDTDEIRIKLLQ